MGTVERCLASSFVRLSRTSKDKSEAALHGSHPRKFACICGCFLCLLRLFAAIPSSRLVCKSIGGPILGADAVVDEEKAGGIVFFFDGF
jgi:hypothetical protein